jgi:carbon storage regulator
MLVLSRKIGEKIVAPQCGLTVAVLGIHGNTVRLGITAPPDLIVHREELMSSLCAGGSADASIDGDRWDEFTCELSDAIYQATLRRPLVSSWLSLEMDVWRKVSTTVLKWKRRLLSAESKSDSRTNKTALVRLPR